MLIVIMITSFLQCTTGNNSKMSSYEEYNSEYLNIIDSVGADTIPIGVKALLSVYSDFIVGYDDGYLRLSDGSKLLYDDKQDKTFVEKMDNADPEDMFSFNYDVESTVPDYLQDAGRSRCEQLFKFMYGTDENMVRKNLIKVNWFGKNVFFTSINGAADSLRSVEKEVKNHPEFLPYMQSKGTFYWRKVRGANRQSAHSYGIAIDIGGCYCDYWLWNNRGKNEMDSIQYINRIPHLLIKIFEKHGFIWGGRWYHYDTMHFEFRPEVLLVCVDK